MKKRLPSNVVVLHINDINNLRNVHFFQLGIIKKYDNMWRPGVSLQHSRIFNILAPELFF